MLASCRQTPTPLPRPSASEPQRQRFLYTAVPAPYSLDSLLQLRHLRVYAEDALVLGEGSRTGAPQAAPKGGAGEGREAFVLAVAPDSSCKEVSQLEMDRRAILQGCRDGFAACYDAFVGGAASLAPAESDGASGETAAVGRQKDGPRGDDGAGVAGPAPR